MCFIVFFNTFRLILLSLLIPAVLTAFDYLKRVRTIRWSRPAVVFIGCSNNSQGTRGKAAALFEFRKRIGGLNLKFELPKTTDSLQLLLQGAQVA